MSLEAETKKKEQPTCGFYCQILTSDLTMNDRYRDREDVKTTPKDNTKF
jgi:hypothetical protein